MGKVATMKRLLPIIILFISLACMTSAGLEEVGSAAASTPPSMTGSQPPEPTGTEDEDGIFYPPEDWQQPAGYNLCAFVTASQSLHLRSEPNENAHVITWLLSGEQVKVISPVSPWWTVETMDGERGYARAKYLQEGECR